MYWYNVNNRLWPVVLSFMLICFSACKPELKETGAALNYFDVKGYFTTDTARLNKMNITVLKAVSHNGSTESKKVKIANWGQELDLFISSDINKPAWKNSYTISGDNGITIYRSKDLQLKTREIVIKQQKNQLKWIMIINHTKNILYETTEKLSYFPDSLYLIEKSQRVKILGTNRYRIEGKIEK